MATPNDSYRTMRAIGKPHGLTSHEVGRVLRDVGLRTPDGQPSELARSKGFCRPYTLDNTGRKAYRWLDSLVSSLAEAWKTKNLASKRRKVQ